MIRLENITKIYNEKVDDTKALDDVSLKIEDGEFISVMGASGSGKSTLLKIIGCMDTPTAGKYFLDDTEVTAASRSQVHKLRKEKIGYVFQHFALMDYYTAYENIELPLLAANVKRKERKRIILKQMEHLGILSERNKLPGKMSGGQQQRVAIARALVAKPAIVLADEPTGNLDSKTSADVMGLIKRTSYEFHQTVVMITHNNEIARLADRIVRIEDGKIVPASDPVITCQCIRVPVLDGHTAAVFVNFEKKPTKEQIIEKWRSFKGVPQELNLPSAPKHFIQYLEEDDRPQVKLDVNYENGMGVSLGRLREDSVFDYKFVGLSHNTLRGAAGGAVLIAELLKAQGYITPKDAE